MEAYARPRVVVSKCLGFAPCRWNGEMLHDSFVERLGNHVQYLPVCPEMDIGLGAPRKPLRLVGAGGRVRMVQPDTGQDVTAEMEAHCREYLGSLCDVDGFLLKNRSPSCGPTDVKIYSSAHRGASSRKGAGLFGAMAQKIHPRAAVEHDGRVRNFALREHFLTKLFTLAAFRHVTASGKMSELVRFHASNKLLLMAYNQQQLRLLGRIVANAGHLPFGVIAGQYDLSLRQALHRSARYSSHINAAQHIMGYFKKQLNMAEKKLFLEMLEEYRQEKLPLSALLAVLRGWVARHGEEYLASQTYFAPYPLELVEISDSGKGRDL